MGMSGFFSARRLSRWGLLLGCCLLAWFCTLASARRATALRLLSAADDPEASCGPVSLAIVARWHGAETTIESLNKLTRAGASGVTSLRDLRDAATALGLRAQAVQLDPKAPLPWELPMILHLHGDHFAAALPVGFNRLVLADPPDEPRLIDRRWLWNDWKGRALVVARNDIELNTSLAAAGFKEQRR